MAVDASSQSMTVFYSKFVHLQLCKVETILGTQVLPKQGYNIVW